MSPVVVFAFKHKDHIFYLPDIVEQELVPTETNIPKCYRFKTTHTLAQGAPADTAGEDIYLSI